MAKVLKNIFSVTDEVQQTFTINAWHVSQSIDALTAADNYDITISGSLTVTGSILHANIQNANGVASSVLVRDDSTGEYYITGSYGNGGSTNTGSLLITASVSNNEITFEKGDGTTFSITVDTGSGGGGSTDYVSNVTYQTGSIDFTGVGSGFDGVININDLTSSLISNDDTGSFMTTGSVSGNTVTFTKGDSTTFDITIVSSSYAVTSSFAVTASHVLNPDYVSTVTYNAGTIDFTGEGNAFDGELNINDLTASLLTTSSFNNATGSFLTSGSFNNGSSTITLFSDNEDYILDLSSLSGGGSGLAITASNEGSVLTENARSFDFVGNAITATNLGNSVTVTVSTGSLPSGLISSSAQIATEISGAFDTGSFMTTGSVTNNTITFTKGDGTTFVITVDTGSGGGGSTDYVSNITYQTGSISFTGVGSAFDGRININDLTASLISNDDTGSFMTTGSVTDNTITFTKGDGTTFDITIVSSSYAVTSSFASSALSSSYAVSSSFAVTASHVLNPDYISDVTYTGGVVDFTGVGNAFDGDININDLTASLISNDDTGSFMTTGSVTNNTITFTKGDGTTFNLTVDTGSGAGGGAPGNDREIIFNDNGDFGASGSFTFQDVGTLRAALIDSTMLGGNNQAYIKVSGSQFSGIDFGGSVALSYSPQESEISIPSSGRDRRNALSLKATHNDVLSDYGRFSFGHSYNNDTTFQIIQKDTEAVSPPASIFRVYHSGSADRGSLVFNVSSSGTIYAPKLANSNQQHLVAYDTASGEITYVTSSDAGGGGGGSSITVKDDGTTLTTAVTEFNFKGGNVSETSTDVIEVEIASRVSDSNASVQTNGWDITPPSGLSVDGGNTLENGGWLKIKVGTTDYYVPAFVISAP